MRRKDREVKSIFKTEQIVKQSICCRIGFIDDEEVYIVPLSFGYEIKDGTYFFYFHGAKEGRKIDLIKKNPNVGFEMDTNYALNEGDYACDYSARFQSIIGNGVVKMLETAEEKKHGLSLVMKHNTGKEEWSFSENEIDAAAVFCMEVTKMSCKEHE